LLSILVTTPKSTNWKNDIMKRHKTMRSSSNDIIEPEAFTHCHWIGLWCSKTGGESIEVEWTPTLWPIQKALWILQSRSTIVKAGVYKFHATIFCTVAPNICGSSVESLLHVTLLGPRILRWLTDHEKNLCTPALTVNKTGDKKNIFRIRLHFQKAETKGILNKTVQDFHWITPWRNYYATREEWISRAVATAYVDADGGGGDDGGSGSMI
jgi:hypothetical protein